MSHGQKRTKKSKVVELEESLGYTTTYGCDPLEKGCTWAMPKYRPAFKEISSEHLQERTWLRPFKIGV
jgi:hypothetical protein